MSLFDVREFVDEQNYIDSEYLCEVCAELLEEYDYTGDEDYLNEAEELMYCVELLEEYDYTGDENYLNEAYNILNEVGYEGNEKWKVFDDTRRNIVWNPTGGKRGDGAYELEKHGHYFVNLKHGRKTQKSLQHQAMKQYYQKKAAIKKQLEEADYQRRKEQYLAQQHAALKKQQEYNRSFRGRVNNTKKKLNNFWNKLKGRL